MKITHLSIFIFVIVSFGCGHAQKISPKDSMKVKQLYARAFACPLHAPVRQKYLDSIILINRTEAYAWQQKAMPLYKRKKYELGSPFLDSAVKYDKGYRWLEYRGFMKCIFEKKYRAAIADFDRSERSNPGGIVMDHSYYFYKGLSYLQLDQPDSAEFYMKKSVNQGILRVGYAHHLENFFMGVVLMEQGKYESAEKFFSDALINYTRFSDAKYYMAVCQRHRGLSADSLLSAAYSDAVAGYTINEDNVIYEEYPYQVRKEQIASAIKSVKAANTNQAKQ